MATKQKPEQHREHYLERALPSSEESERVILGSILNDNQLASAVFAKLVPEDFYSPYHRIVGEAMQYLFQHSSPIDPILISEVLKTKGALESIGGIAPITNLVHGLPHFSNINEYIVIVKKKALARQLIRINNQFTGEILAEEEDIDSVLATTISTLIQLQGFYSKMSTATLAQVAAEVRKMFAEWRVNDLTGSSLRTGLPEVDDRLRLRGIAKGDLTLVCARPSVGKTALLIQISSHIARLGVPWLFISLEMDRGRIVMRMLPPIANIYNKAINPLTFKNLPRQADALESAVTSIEHLPLYFDSTRDIDQIVAVIEYFVQTKQIGGFALDYITMVKYEHAPRNMSRVDIVGYIVTELKEVAMRNRIAGLAAAQLGRSYEDTDRDPMMSDIRESGIIEQAADTILFLFDPKGKEHALTPDLIKNRMYVDLLCGKQRDGERGWRAKLDYDKNLQTFTTIKMDQSAPRAYRDYHMPDDREDDD